MKRTSRTLAHLALASALAAGTAHAALIEPEAAVPQAAVAAPGDPSAAWLVANPTPADRAYALAAGATDTADALQATAASVGSRILPSASTISLWTFITSMQAQQRGDRFVILETHVSLLQLAESPPAPVPLPGAVWLLVMGLLGFAGVRITGQGAATAPRLAPGPRPLLPAL